MSFRLNDTQVQLQQSARGLAERYFAPKAYTWEESQAYPFSNLEVLAENELTGMPLPVSKGGQGAGILDTLLVLEQIGEVCPHTADAFHVSNLGAICQIAEFGSDSLREKVLPRLLSGKEIVSIGMSEPDAGSAVTELSTTARLTDDEVVVDGQKVFNSEAPHASWWVIWVRVGEDRHSIGAVIVPRGAPGFSLGRTAHFMPGVQHSTLHFDACRVPRDNVLVEDNGLRRMMTVFNVERLGNATRSLALGQAAFDMAREYAASRKQFGRYLSEFQGIQWKFADMQLGLEASRLLIYRAAANADANGGAPDKHETALAKCHANVKGFEAANESLQVFGGYGYDAGSRINYLFRRTRGWMIAGGTVEILRNQISKHVFADLVEKEPR